ncbi:MAG: aldolase/citrate lyase family protein [Arcobacteraceae bacterium]
MNILEKEMVEVLKKLKNEYGVIEIKAEYENEGSRQDELMRLKDVASSVDLPIIIKIGGVEAITDIYNAITLGVHGIIAPMAETKFAVSKFTNAIETFVSEDNREDIEFAFNVETITGYDNLDEILSLKNLNVLSGVTIGRVDFTASMDKDRNFVDSDEMLNYCINVFEKSRAKGLKCGLGGAISSNSADFIKTLVSQNLIDKYETRKIVYDKDAISNIENGILAGVEFELLWLKSKRRYYNKIKIEDEKRIEMLQKRLNS